MEEFLFTKETNKPNSRWVLATNDNLELMLRGEKKYDSKVYNSMATGCVAKVEGWDNIWPGHKCELIRTEVFGEVLLSHDDENIALLEYIGDFKPESIYGDKNKWMHAYLIRAK